MGNRLGFVRKSHTLTDAQLEQLGKNALRERDALLKKYPHLVAFQNEIDRVLKNAGGFENRMAVLGLMMESNLQQLKKHLTDLAGIAHKYADA